MSNVDINLLPRNGADLGFPRLFDDLLKINNNSTCYQALQRTQRRPRYIVKDSQADRQAGTDQKKSNVHHLKKNVWRYTSVYVEMFEKALLI